MNKRPSHMAEDAFLRFGGNIAYMRKMNSEQTLKLFPNVKELPAGDYYVLYATDGSPIVLTDSRQSAVGYARTEELDLALVH